LVRIYSMFGSAPTAGVGLARVEAQDSTGGVWDWIQVSVPPMQATPQPGYFPAEIVNLAVAGRRKWKGPVSITLAQWALESTWGTALAADNNPFGVKATGTQASGTAETKEVVDGKEVTVRAKFRSFDSMSDAFEAHSRLLATAPQYQRAMSFSDNP